MSDRAKPVIFHDCQKSKKEEKRMGKVRATRHNGRKGASGVFKPEHNDRSFNVENSDHIREDRCSANVYWDLYQGFNIPDENGNRPERKFNFGEIERAYYHNTFIDSIDAQNERHIRSRHKERCRELDDILKDPKTCPEESVYQLGTKDGHEDPVLFTRVVVELFDELIKRYGSNFKILDWALHMDEATPHIHERHVFFADDGYGMLFPKQGKACEALGFELPDPTKKEGPKNNRKMSFDAEVRKLYIEIAEKYGVIIEKVPLEGRTHLEKNDFILAKQNEEIAQKQEELNELTMKISDIDAMVKDVAEAAYEKAVETVTDTVREETTKENISVVEAYGKEIARPEHRIDSDKRSFAGRLLQGLIDLLKRKSAELSAVVRRVLLSPEVKQRNQDAIAHKAKTSLLERLARAKQEADADKRERKHPSHDRGDVR